MNRRAFMRTTGLASRIIHAAVYVALLLLAYSFYGWAATIIAACVIFYIIETRTDIAKCRSILECQIQINGKQCGINSYLLGAEADRILNQEESKPTNAGQNQKDQEDLKCN